MSKIFCAILILSLLLASFIIASKPVLGVAQAEDSWVSKAPMHQARGGLGVVAVNDKIYAIGGANASGLYPPDIQGGFVATNEQYDVTTDIWAFKSPMPTPRDYFAIAAYQNKIYCIGGAVGNNIDKTTHFSTYIQSGVNEAYDTITDKWETKTPMPATGMDLQANVMDGKIFVTGTGLTYIYDPATDSWTNETAIPPFPLIGSGASSSSITIGNKTINTGIIDGAAAETTGVVAPQRIYVLGILSELPPPSVNHVYDPKSDTWTAASAMPTLRMDFGVAVVNDTLYVIGGFNLTQPLYNYVTPIGFNEQYIPVGYGTVSPVVSVASPGDTTYSLGDVSLNFSVNQPVGWVCYSLDGKDNVTVAGNTTLLGLSNGLHNVTVYANDTFGNVGASQMVSFTVAVPQLQQPFPTVTVVVAASLVAVVIIGAALAVYVKKRRRRL